VFVGAELEASIPPDETTATHEMSLVSLAEDWKGDMEWGHPRGNRPIEPVFAGGWNEAAPGTMNEWGRRQVEIHWTCWEHQDVEGGPVGSWGPMFVAVHSPVEYQENRKIRTGSDSAWQVESRH